MALSEDTIHARANLREKHKKYLLMNQEKIEDIEHRRLHPPVAKAEKVIPIIPPEEVRPKLVARERGEGCNINL